MDLGSLLWMCTTVLLGGLLVLYVMITKDAAIPHLQARFYRTSYLFMIHENKSVRPVMVTKDAVQRLKHYGVYQFSQETAYSYLGVPAFFANASGPAASCSIEAFIAASKLRHYNIYPDRPFLENLHAAIIAAQDPSTQQAVFLDFFKTTKTPGEWKKINKAYLAAKAANDAAEDRPFPGDVYSWEFSRLSPDQQDDLITLAGQNFLLSGTDFSALHQYANLNNGAMIEAQINHQVNLRTRKESAGLMSIKIQWLAGAGILILLACLGVYLLTSGNADTVQQVGTTLLNTTAPVIENVSDVGI